MNLKTILVPLDGSVLAEAALMPAANLARQTGAKLVLLRAAAARRLPMLDPVHAQVEVMREAQEYLGAVRARVLAAGVVDVESSVWYGSALEAIVEGARYRHADLIVMSSHGRSGLNRLVLGSVAESVLRCTRVPILLSVPTARQSTRPSWASRTPRRSPMYSQNRYRYRQVLVALDGSLAGETVLRFLMEIAGPLDMTVMLVHVLEPITPQVTDGTVVVDDIQARRRDAEEYRAPISATLRSQGVETAWAVEAAPALKEASAR